MPTTPTTQDGAFAAGLARARRVSAFSLAWTMAASGVALAAGLAARSLVLVAFALAGTLDAIGSAALVGHFGRAMRTGAVSERLERAVLVVVACGMGAVAASTVAQGVMRLATDRAAEPSVVGTVLAAVSAVVLTRLARVKASLGRALPSPALLADSHLSGFGALLALITLVGTGTTAAFEWTWLDPLAALLVALLLVAVTLSVARDARALPAKEL